MIYAFPVTEVDVSRNETINALDAFGGVLAEYVSEGKKGIG